ncbi:MAG: radical SAM protein [Acidobacteriota bacterium]
MKSSSAPAPSSRAEDRRLRALRPPKPPVDPWRAHGTKVERELSPEGALERSLTVFLSGQECAFTCAFCDLWRYTTETPTPPGAIPSQLADALEEDRRQHPEAADVIKLYNASNFFDRSVPASDDEPIARLMDGISRVVVECHPKLVGRRCASFAERLSGRLEVAMGFETAHPEALRRLNKKAKLEDLARAAGRLRRSGLDLRAFLLLGVPHVPAAQQMKWLERSVRFALEQGARLVAIIPLRGGEGELARLEAAGEWRPPTLGEVEEGFERARALSPRRVRLDTWDLEVFAAEGDAGPRLERRRRQQLEPAAWERSARETPA